MATNPSILCLQDLQEAKPSNIIKLVPLDKKGKASSDDSQNLLQALVAMVQILTMTMSELSMVASKEQQTNNGVAQLNVSASNNQIDQAEKTQKKLEESQHEAGWQKALNIFLQYVLPVVIIAVTALVLGPAAAGIAAAVVLLTMNIPGVGDSVTGMAAKAIAENIGKAEGWSKETIEAVTGGINLALAVVLGVASGFAAAGATAATVVDTAAEMTDEAAIEMTDMAADTVSTVAEDGSTTADAAADGTSKAAKLASTAKTVVGLGAFSSQVSNSNCFYDMIYGTWVSVNPAEKDKASEYAGYIAAAINVIIGVIAVIAGGSGIASSIEDASTTTNTLAQKLEQLGFSSSKTLTYLNNATRVGMLANAGMDGYQAYVVQNIAGLRSDMTRIMGFLKELLGSNLFLSRNSNMINSNLKTNLENLETLLQGLPDFGSMGKTEAQAMIRVNQQA